MTDEKRNMNIEIIRKDTPEQLLARYDWYCANFNPVDDDRCENYELVRAEILRRMEAK